MYCTKNPQHTHTHTQNNIFIMAVQVKGGGNQAKYIIGCEDTQFIATITYKWCLVLNMLIIFISRIQFWVWKIILPTVYEMSCELCSWTIIELLTYTFFGFPKQNNS